MNNVDLDFEVKEANKRFYNTVADIYEKVDGRRTGILERWLRYVLENLSKSTESRVLLDIGCGTGVVLRNGSRFFKHSYGIDISQEILKKMDNNNGICADGSFIPFKDATVDVVTCFSVLHHIYDYRGVFKEIYRILKKGGLLYIDHDIDRTFVRRFYPIVKLYRFIFNPANRYMSLKKGLTRELYALSEIHSSGIDSVNVLNQLRCIGFSMVEVCYHWFGLNSVVDRIMKYSSFKRGFAPLVHIVVKK